MLPYDYTSPVPVTFPSVDPSGSVKVTDDCSIPQLVSIARLVSDFTEGLQAIIEKQWEQSILLVDLHLIVTFATGQSWPLVFFAASP